MIKNYIVHGIRGTNFWDTLNIYIFNKFAKNLFKIYRYFCFIFLFTSSSPCRKEQFAVLWFSSSYYCTEPGLQLGDPAPLKGFVTVDLLIFYILVKIQSTGLHMDALSTPVFYRWTPRSYVAPRLATVVAPDTLWAKVVILLIN